MNPNAWTDAFALAAYEIPGVVGVYRGRFSRVPSVTVVIERCTLPVLSAVNAVSEYDTVKVLRPFASAVLWGVTPPDAGELIGRRP